MKGCNKIAMMLELTVNVQLIVLYFFLENVFGHSMNKPKLKYAVFHIFQKRFGILGFFTEVLLGVFRVNKSLS